MNTDTVAKDLVRTFRYSLVGTALLLISACSPLATSVKPSADIWKSYEVGKTYQSSTGSPMISAARAYTYPTFSPVSRFDPPSVAFEEEAKTFKPSQKWTARKKNDSGYFLTPPYEMGQITLHVTPNGKVGDGWMNAVTYREMNDGDWPDRKLFERVRGELTKGSFEFELLYTGRQGPNLQLVYREYLDGMQRPAYSQDLSYNLQESDIVTFRSIQIRVVEATNSKIRFQIMEDGELPWLPNQ